MKRLLSALLVLSVAACSEPPLEDVTAYYAKPEGIAFKVEAAANGDARVTAGDQVMIHKGSAEYLVTSDATGAYAGRVADYVAVLDEAPSSGPFAGQSRPQPDYVTAEDGAATVAGMPGVKWKIHPKDVPSLRAIDAVVSDDPALAVLGTGVAMHAKLLIERNSRGLGAKPGNLETAMMALYNKGAVLRFGTVFELERIEKGAIPADRFRLPPVLDKAALKKRMASGV
ncbi:hypothetical protein [Sphingomonas sp. LT1P40]|uniref:hypothetical protein n=1 Tax=Alteristakelama amylovorans TaxID=3096166 RepID=UPI002FCC77C0